MPVTTTTQSETEQPERSRRGIGVNRVILVGRTVAQPQLRTTQTGTAVTTVRIATNDRSEPQFHDVVLWGQLAEFACQHATKGRLVMVEGRLQSRSWESDDGSRHRVTEVVANQFEALTPKTTEAEG